MDAISTQEGAFDSFAHCEKEIIVHNTLIFLVASEDVIRWSWVSKEYLQLVRKLKSNKLIAMRRVENLLGYSFDNLGCQSQDWNLTYRILSTEDPLVQSALYFTNSEIDRKIAERKLLKPCAKHIFRCEKLGVYTLPFQLFKKMFLLAVDAVGSYELLQYLIIDASNNCCLEFLEIGGLDQLIAMSFTDNNIQDCMNRLVEESNLVFIDRFLYLLKAEWKTTVMMSSSVEIMVRDNNLRLIKVFHKHGLVDPFEVVEYSKYDGAYTPFSLACKLGRVNIVKFFTSLGNDNAWKHHDINFDLTVLIKRGQIEIFELLRYKEWGLVITYGCLELAVKQNSIKFLEYMKERSWSYNTESEEECRFSDDNLCSSLLIAVTANSVEVSTLLLGSIKLLSCYHRKRLVAAARHDRKLRLLDDIQLHD